MLVFLVATVGLAAAPETRLYHGMPAKEVVAALGAPQSTVRMGDREILQFAGGIRVELREGKLYQARGVTVDLHAPRPTTEGTEVNGNPTTTVTDASPATTKPIEATPPLQSASPPPATESRETIPDTTEEPTFDEGEEMPWDTYLEGAEAEEPTSDGTRRLIEFILTALITGGLIRWGFARAGMPILFKPLSLIVACYVGVAGLLRIIPWGAEMREHFHLNDILLFITLYVLVKIFSDACEDLTILKIVVGTMIAARIFGFVIIILGLFLLGQLA